MKDSSLITRGNIDVKPSFYNSIFRKYGHITFEVNESENLELIKLTNDFKEIENQPEGFNREKWIKENIDLNVTSNSFAIFSFLILCWSPSTILSNIESSNSDLIYLCVINENATQ